MKQAKIKRPAMFIQKAPEQDRMPKQVATEMLCAPLARLRNRMRKECMAARTTVYESSLQPKPFSVMAANRFHHSTWEQLHRWNRRIAGRRMRTQRAWEKVTAKRAEFAAQKPIKEEEQAALRLRIALLDRSISMYEMVAEQLVQLWDAIDDEIRWRTRNVCNQ